MDFYIFNIAVLLVAYQFHGISAKRHGSGYHDDQDDRDDSNDLEDHCIHIRIDHNTKYTDYLICPYGCCGTLDNQVCCEDPANQNDEANPRLVRGLLILAGVMVAVALSCCVFGIYKHKKAKLRKTVPEMAFASTTPVARMARLSPRAIYYTPGSGLTPSADKKDQPIHNKPPQGTMPDSGMDAPPGYTEKARDEPNPPPYPAQSPPPPYSSGFLSAAPSATAVYRN